MDDDMEDGDSGICDSCGKECNAVRIDFGIGAYEYWGSTGVHHDYGWASPCCEAKVVRGGNKVVRRSVHVARRDHADGKIRKGDRYQVSVERRWRVGGPSWFIQRKRRLEPAAPAAPAAPAPAPAAPVAQA